MKSVLYLAWQYLRWHRWKTLILVTAVTLVLYLPVGLQLIGPHFAESRLLNIGHRLQQATDWHLQQPAGIEGESD